MNTRSKPRKESDDDQRILEILDQYLVELEQGRSPDSEKIIASHPELAQRLRELFLSLVAVEALGVSMRAESANLNSQTNLPAIEGYRIVRELGRGGMGVVFEAEELSLSRTVALKVLPLAAVFDQKSLMRFKNEALATAQFDHPNIINVYSVGCDQGLHFYAMQLVDGQSLAEVIDSLRAADNSLPVIQTSDLTTSPHNSSDEIKSGTRRNKASQANILSTRNGRLRNCFQAVASLGADAADALHHAHQLGIVHRDIKPSNLLVDVTGKVHVSDFGLASMQTESNLTASGDLVGTLRYMSPEQASGKPELVDHRTDIYSLGATLYELLTCQSIVQSDDRKEILKSILDEKIRLPSRINRFIPRDLEIIVMKALSWDREHRYASALEFADDLRRFVDDQPVLARRPTLIQRLSLWTRRNRWIALTAAVSGLVLFVVSIVSTITIYRWYDKAVAAESDLKAKIIETNRALDRAETAEKALAKKNEHLINVLARVDEADGRIAEMPIRLIERGRDFFRKKQYRAAIDIYETALQLGDSRSALCHLLMCRAYYELWEFDEASKSATVCIEDAGLERPDATQPDEFARWEPYYERARAKMAKVPPPSRQLRGVDCGEEFSWWRLADLKQANSDAELANKMVPENVKVFDLLAKTRFNLGLRESDSDRIRSASEMARSFLNSNMHAREMVEIRLLSLWKLGERELFADEFDDFVDEKIAQKHGHLAMLKSLYHFQRGERSEGKRWYAAGIRQLLYRYPDYDYHEQCIRNSLIAAAAHEANVYFDAWNDVETWLEAYSFRIDSSDLLSRVSNASNDVLYLQDNMNYLYGPHWTPEDKRHGNPDNGIHIFWRPEGKNCRLQFELVDTANPRDKSANYSTGRHRLCTRLTRSNDFAIVQFWWNGEKLGEPIDLYHKYPTQDGEIDLGWVEVIDGKNFLEIEIVGVNESVDQPPAVGIDSVDLWPADYLPGRSLSAEISRRINNLKSRLLKTIESNK